MNTMEEKRLKGFTKTSLQSTDTKQENSLHRKVYGIGGKKNKIKKNSGFYSFSVVSGVHRHRWGLTHAGCWSWGLLLRGPTTHQMVERGSTLNECVQSFLDTRVVKIDAWSRGGGSLNTGGNWHSAWRVCIPLRCRCRRTWHWWAGWVLGRRLAKRSIWVWLWGCRGEASSAC